MFMYEMCSEHSPWIRNNTSTSSPQSPASGQTQEKIWPFQFCLKVNTFWILLDQKSKFQDGAPSLTTPLSSHLDIQLQGLHPRALQLTLTVMPGGERVSQITSRQATYQTKTWISVVSKYLLLGEAIILANFSVLSCIVFPKNHISVQQIWVFPDSNVSTDHPLFVLFGDTCLGAFYCCKLV